MQKPDYSPRGQHVRLLPRQCGGRLYRHASARQVSRWKAFGLLAETRAPPLFHIDMKMVLVGFIGIR
jgi:hypothetical protein